MISTSVHPDYILQTTSWTKYRYTMEGGSDYIDKYLIKFSDRESDADFEARKLITPIPGFAAAALNDIKNAIFQRLETITRAGSSKVFAEVMNGQHDGVDLHGSTMTHFIGREVLPELLFMGKVGVYVDMPQFISSQPTLTESKNSHPYYYVYKAEQIRNWTTVKDTEFTRLLLQENHIEADEVHGLPTSESVGYRFLELGLDHVIVRFYNQDSEQVDQNGYPTDQSTILDINKIPFILFELDRSLLQDIANHQIALLNMESADVSYSLKANFPFYTEQYSGKQQSTHLKETEEGEAIDVGTVQGRRYGVNLERPQFIHPSSEPLTASMDKQKNLKDDIRGLVNLALSAIRPKFASAESKGMDERGLESGLSFLGLILEHGERQLATLFSKYEGEDTVATIHYPGRYNLKTDLQRLDEANKLNEQIATVPSVTYQKAIAKEIAIILLDAKVSASELETILNEIEKADYISSDPESIYSDVEKGILSLATAAKIRGYDKKEVIAAAKDHAERIARIQAAQSKMGKEVDPAVAAKAEKENSQDADKTDDAKKKVKE